MTMQCHNNPTFIEPTNTTTLTVPVKKSMFERMEADHAKPYVDSQLKAHLDLIEHDTKEFATNGFGFYLISTALPKVATVAPQHLLLQALLSAPVANALAVTGCCAMIFGSTGWIITYYLDKKLMELDHPTSKPLTKKQLKKQAKKERRRAKNDLQAYKKEPATSTKVESPTYLIHNEWYR